LAWPLGPVFVNVWKRPTAQGNALILTPSDHALSDEVFQQLGSMSGRALAAHAHEKYVEWGFARLGLKPTECGSHTITPEIIRKLALCDRLAIEGNKVKVFRRDSSITELNRGVKQLATLYQLGARFEEVLIQAI
jgi:hypothetical protein